MFREDKVTQMAARFLALADGRLPYILLMKMLYLADKQMLVQWGKPITYDQWCSTPQGPVLSATLKLIKSEPPTAGVWSDHIVTHGPDIVLKADPGNDDLSRAEDTVIEQTFREWGDKRPWAAATPTQNFPEGDAPGSHWRPISYETVLEVSGFSRQEAADILENIAVQDDVFGLERVA